MKKLPNWNISKESTQRLAGLLDRGAGFGIDPDAVTDAGLPAWRTLTVLLQAADSPEGPNRDRLLDRAQDALQALDVNRNGKLLQQFQARLLALRGRAGDDEIAHVTEGELVVPEALQTPEVLKALQAAADSERIPLNHLRVGSSENTVNPATGVREFNATKAYRIGTEEQETILPSAEPLDQMLRNPLVDQLAKIDLAPPSDVVYYNEDGSATVSSGGTRAWRNNNPGNIHYGPFARSHGAIGSEKGFAIFPNVEAGAAALDELFATSDYQNSSLNGALERYAPKTENDTARYQKFVGDKVGVPGETLIKDLTPDQLQTLKSRIRQFEGWRPGKVF